MHRRTGVCPYYVHVDSRDFMDFACLHAAWSYSIESCRYFVGYSKWAFPGLEVLLWHCTHYYRIRVLQLKLEFGQMECGDYRSAGARIHVAAAHHRGNRQGMQ